MGHTELVALVARIAMLDKADPNVISILLGAELVAVGSPARWTEYQSNFGTSAFAAATARLDYASGHGILRIVPHDPAPTRAALGIGGIGSFDHLDLNPNIPPEGVTTYIRSRHASVAVGPTHDEITVATHYAFTSRSEALREIVVSWQPRRYPLGEEPIFQSAPPLLYIRSYDTVNEVLEYAPQTRAFRILSRAEFATLGRTEALGAFARGVPAKSGAGELMGGVFATPEGPAIIAGSKRALVYPPKTEARIDKLPEHRRRFSLLRGGTHQLELIYEERHGIGTNPYDVEEADVDLFAAIQRGLKDERWLSAFKRPWLA